MHSFGYTREYDNYHSFITKHHLTAKALTAVYQILHLSATASFIIRWKKTLKPWYVHMLHEIF